MSGTNEDPWAPLYHAEYEDEPGEAHAPEPKKPAGKAGKTAARGGGDETSEQTPVGLVLGLPKDFISAMWGACDAMNRVAMAVEENTKAVLKVLEAVGKPKEEPAEPEPKPLAVNSYAEGGEVDVDTEVSKLLAQRPNWAARLSAMRPAYSAKDTGDTAAAVDPSPATRDVNEFTMVPAQRKEIGLAEGGEVTDTAGPPIGKDDGLIAAQDGEWVIRKSAVKKLEQDHGPDAMETINKGRLPS